VSDPPKASASSENLDYVVSVKLRNRKKERSKNDKKGRLKARYPIAVQKTIKFEPKTVKRFRKDDVVTA
jgi:hypothetical protein